METQSTTHLNHGCVAWNSLKTSVKQTLRAMSTERKFTDETLPRQLC